MTKSNRHKKFRKQEKAKTQLTGVKKLSKAKNVVEPTLKVKKILIREQLKAGSLTGKGGNQPSSSFASLLSGAGTLSSKASSVRFEDEETYTRRRQSVQDLISSANHHNVNMRKDAVIGLQEIAISNFNTIIRNLDRIVTKIASLTTDQEAIVRRENLKLAECVLSKISENQLRPFWNMLIAHLKCALTHLIPSVRYGALSFIEVLVDHHSNLVSDSSSIILPTVLGLVSTTHTKDSTLAKSKNSNSTRLKVEISGKHSDATERLKVLQMLSKCLSISTSSLNLGNGDTGSTSSTIMAPSNYLGLRYPFGYCWDQEEESRLNKKYDLSSSFNSAYSNRLYSSITANPFDSPFSVANSSSRLSGSNFWIEFLNACIPVLIETWVELGPVSSSQPSTFSGKSEKIKFKKGLSLGNDKDGNFGGRRNGLHILNEADVDTILCITTLFELLLKRAAANAGVGIGEEFVKTVRKTQGQNMTKYFFLLMPFVALQDPRRKDVTTVNLKLFKIAGELKMFDNELKKNLKRFIEGAMERRNLEQNHTKEMLGVMNCIESNQIQSLCSKFLCFAAKQGHFEIVSKFLSGLINPTAQYVSNKGILDLVINIDWNAIISVLIQSWKVSSRNEDILYLSELLAFVALKRLTDMREILCQHVSKLKYLVSNTTKNSTKSWDSLYRTFVFSDAQDAFKNEFIDVCPPYIISTYHNSFL